MRNEHGKRNKFSRTEYFVRRRIINANELF